MSNRHKCPLTGKTCNRPKCVRIADVVGDQVHEMHLCKECASAYLSASPSSAPVSKGEAVIQPASPLTKECPDCGWTLAMLAEKLRFGCCNCYGFFGDEALHLMKKAHGATKHVGKVPKAWKARKDAGVKNKAPVNPDLPQPDPKEVLKRSIEERILDLEGKMAVKIKEEEYEDAAVLRDAIKVLKTEKDS